MPQFISGFSNRWLLPVLVVFSFFFLLGGRSLNEPDEGRYSEVAREMLERNDWVVPHLWYAPHLDKPPLAYWAVALSMACFGQNEWAVRFPLALAGLSGVAAAWFLARSMGGPRASRWAAIILTTSLLYYLLARVLTPDIFLTQFVAWAGAFLWRGWRSLDDLSHSDEAVRAHAGRRFFLWQMAAYSMMGLGVLTKGPIAVIIPLGAVLAVSVLRRGQTIRWQLHLLCLLPGLLVLGLIAGPWFMLALERLPVVFDYMIKGQFLGHALGTTIKNRSGPPYYFFGIIAVGFMPWTLLLGWLWRRKHWRQLPPAQQEAWLFLSTWVLLTFTIFSCTRAKLPAYILPLFPALAIMVSLRWFGDRETGAVAATPSWVWRGVKYTPLVWLTAMPVLFWVGFKVSFPVALFWALAVILTLVYRKRNDPVFCALWAVGFNLYNFYIVSLLAPGVESSLKANQPMKLLAAAIKREYKPGDTLVCLTRFPQGLPFYTAPIINPTNRPYFGLMPLDKVPFEFTGNRERFAPLLLTNAAAVDRLITNQNRVLFTGYRDTFDQTQTRLPNFPLKRIARFGDWELFSNRP